ncbi:hypothetical protein [Legionella maioricensis]|uniref:Uncharacterized protein n=1 Tax=Legionella maioricensis TaxID=2896528 RepID=A0A9X2CZ24_9GAMM|nr:hypothetical protein [Legionella maioricensis]MCL9683163.1 hypothetical protein [Legionella maioricensis]MCL9688062.1 hypothetical protein [Legionella maioricensis]
MPGFFSTIDNKWDGYSSLRRRYADAVPIPQASYFDPIRSISDMATLAVRPIEKPLWLAFNALGFLIKAIVNLAVAVVLAPCALLLALVAPTSGLRSETCDAFKLAAAQTVVSVGMGAIALLSAVAALLFNPLHIVTRALATVFDCINSTTESCCDVESARLRY